MGWVVGRKNGRNLSKVGEPLLVQNDNGDTGCNPISFFPWFCILWCFVFDGFVWHSTVRLASYIGGYNPRVEHLICLFLIVFSLALCICCILHCSTCSSAGFLSCKMINGRESHLLCNLSEMSFLCCQKVPSSIRIYSSIRIHTQYAIWGFIHLPAHCAQVHRCHKKVLFCELIV